MEIAKQSKSNLQPHIPVLLDEVIKYVSPKDEEIYVDGTFGAGGHTQAMLNAANCRVFAIDCDPSVKVFVTQLSEKYDKRIEFVEGKFADMESLIKQKGVQSVNGILLDVGVSSMQLDIAERGFSFSHDGPLDMRMSGEGRNASDLINNAEEKDLADIIYKYGDERKSRKIAKAIIMARSVEPITRTGQLADVIRGAVRKYTDTIDPATRTFQALRIWVNDELKQLEKSLEAAEAMLAPEGRLAVITFHSGEDAIVKSFMRERSGASKSYSRYQPVPKDLDHIPTFEILSKKAIKPSEEEVKRNPRSRSAKLRVAVRTEAPAWKNKGYKKETNND